MRDRFVRLHIFSAFSHYLWLCLDFEIRGSWRVFRRKTKCYQYIAPTPQASVNPIGSLSSDDSDGSENGKKKKKKKKKHRRFRLTKQTTLHVHHPFLYVVWTNVPNFTFCRGLEHKTTIFFSWTLIQSFRIQLRRNLPTFDELNVRDGISAIKFQAARINNFLRDVFVAVAVVVA